MTDETKGDVQFDKYWSSVMTHPHLRAYNNPLGLPADGDLRGAMKMGWDAAMKVAAQSAMRVDESS